MVKAQPRLANVTRIKSDVAESDGTNLLNLYQRHPVMRTTLSLFLLPILALLV